MFLIRAGKLSHFKRRCQKSLHNVVCGFKIGETNGWCFAGIQPGDRIAIIAGMPRPIVVRPCGGSVLLVGPCGFVDYEQAKNVREE
jgi:hypothetical protein